MESFQLTPEEIVALRAEHRQMSFRTDAYRINAIILLGTGWTQIEVAEALLLDERTIRRYVKAYKENGIQGLLEVRFQGGLAYLDTDEINRLDKHLQQTLYLQVADIQQYIKETFDVSYTISGVTQLLHRMNYVYKKPKHVPGKANREDQEAFLGTYHQLKDDKRPDDPIYFMDAAHPQHNSVPSYGWIKQGQEAEIKANCGRQRLNINGAIDIETMTVVYRFDDTINADSTLALFEQLERKHPASEVINVIADNARYYRSTLVKEFLETSRIQIHFLPAYSPNLNLIERLWKYFRKNVLYNQYYETFLEFLKAAKRFFSDIRRKKHRDALRTLLTENFHLFAV